MHTASTKPLSQMLWLSLCVEHQPWNVRGHQMNNVLTQCALARSLSLGFIVRPILLVFPHHFIRTVRCIYLFFLSGSKSGDQFCRWLTVQRMHSNKLLFKSNDRKTKNGIMEFYGFLVLSNNLWLRFVWPHLFLPLSPALAFAFHFNSSDCILTSFEYFMWWSNLIFPYNP